MSSLSAAVSMQALNRPAVLRAGDQEQPVIGRMNTGALELQALLGPVELAAVVPVHVGVQGFGNASRVPGDVQVGVLVERAGAVHERGDHQAVPAREDLVIRARLLAGIAGGEQGAVHAGQPLVRWRVDVHDRESDESRVIEGHVEVRWSHGKFGGAPEAKVYLDTPHHEVAGYEPLDAGS